MLTKNYFFEIGGFALKTALSEIIGTFGFVFVGTGAIVFSAPFIGWLGIALAAGLSYAAMSFAFPDGHFNPMFSIAAFCAKRENWKTALIRLFGQTAGAFTAAWVLSVVLNGKTGFVADTALAGNYSDRYSVEALLTAETVLDALFVAVFLATQNTAKAPAALGVFLTGATFVGYPIAKGAMNPVKSTALAVFSTPEAVASLKYFWACGIAAAVVCGLVALLMAHQQRNVGVQNQALGETAQNPAAH